MLLYLPEAALQLLCDIIAKIADSVEWPPLATKVVFIVKRLGGVRPLGLLHCLCRIQARLRRPLVALWQMRNYRSFWWGTKGKGADMCVYIQAVWAEYYQAKGLSSATAS
eukprot:5584359-Pyramimonas_sp.AAC.1